MNQVPVPHNSDDLAKNLRLLYAHYPLGIICITLFVVIELQRSVHIPIYAISHLNLNITDESILFCIAFSSLEVMSSTC